MAGASSIEHLLIAESGTDDQSRYLIMAGVRVDDPNAVAELLTDTGDERVLEVLRQGAFDINIAFASKSRMEALGEDWRYAFLTELARDTFHLGRRRERGYPVVAHLPEGMPLDFSWLDAYLTHETYGLARFHTSVAGAGDRIMLLPLIVGRVFGDALEADVGRPSAARERYDALAPLVKHVEDVGNNVSYCHGGTTADAIVRISFSS